MNLKQAILSIFSRDDLKYLVDDLEIDGVDRRSIDRMRSILQRSQLATVEVLLGYLYKDELKQVHEC